MRQPERPRGTPSRLRGAARALRRPDDLRQRQLWCLAVGFPRADSYAAAPRAVRAPRSRELLAPRRDDIAVVKSRHSAFYETPLQLLLQQLESARTHHYRRFDRVVRTVHRDGCVRPRLPLAVCRRAAWPARSPSATQRRLHTWAKSSVRTLRPARLLPAHAGERFSEPRSSGNYASPMRPRCRRRRRLPPAAN